MTERLKIAFREMLINLKKRGGMYVRPFNYATLVAYVSGYDHALQDAGLPSELDAFREWLHNRVGYHCSLHWSVVVKDMFANNDDEEAVVKLFELYQEFADQS